MELELQETNAALSQVWSCSPENGLLQEPGTSPESSFVFLTSLLCIKSTMLNLPKDPYQSQEVSGAAI